MVALVNDEDFEYLSQFKWQSQPNGRTYYAIRTATHPTRKTIRMHREILNAPESMEVDHVDANGLNCQRNNIRLCTKEQNQQRQRAQLNKKYSIFKGVSSPNKGRIWESKILSKRIGCFRTEREAALAYDLEAKKLFGNFATTNF